MYRCQGHNVTGSCLNPSIANVSVFETGRPDRQRLFQMEHWEFVGLNWFRPWKNDAPNFFSLLEDPLWNEAKRFVPNETKTRARSFQVTT
jgi:hypothetical protein